MDVNIVRRVNIALLKMMDPVSASVSNSQLSCELEKNS